VFVWSKNTQNINTEDRQLGRNAWSDTELWYQYGFWPVRYGADGMVRDGLKNVFQKNSTQHLVHC